MFRRSQTTPLAADGASFFDDDDDDNEDDPLLTQPPSVLNTVCSPSPACNPGEFFLDSIRRTIDNEHEFNNENAKYTSPPPPPAVVIPDYVSSAIRNVLSLTWGCTTPRPYQIKAIYHLVYTKMDMMYLIRKTGEGKSLVLQGMASMLKGVTVVMVPLLGLGADQEEKCNGANASSVESYHLDEYRQSNASELRGHLDDYSREEKTAIILFVGPQQLSQHSFWCPVLMSLALRGCISAVCIDEVHSTVQNYESFRPEFKTAIESINKLVGASRRNCPDTYYVPILVMSATFTIKDQHIFNSLIGRLPTMAIWRNMSRRNISFNVTVAGDPLNRFCKDWILTATKQPTKQSLVYSNSSQTCDNAILNRLFNARTKVPINNGKFMALTGDCGMMLKSFLMASFCGDVHDDNLPRIWCMACTSAANCGVSSKNCTSCFRIGPPPSWHEMVQEMGRVDRLHTDAVGINTYNIYFNLNTFLSLWLRVQSESKASVRVRLLDDLMDILNLLVLPSRCYHDVIEEHFEHPTLYDSTPSCNNNCSFCDGSYAILCGPISKAQLISLLTTNIFENGKVPAMSLLSTMSSPSNKRFKEAIWRGKKDVPAGNVHALILMLIASNILHLELDNKSSTSIPTTSPMRSIQLALTKEYAHVGDDFETFSINIDSNWSKIPCAY